MRTVREVVRITNLCVLIHNMLLIMSETCKLADEEGVNNIKKLPVEEKEMECIDSEETSTEEEVQKMCV